MKNLLKLILLFSLLSITACNSETKMKKNQVSAVLESGINGAEESSAVEETSAKAKVNNPYDNIDVDLTVMPKQLAYTTANRMNLVSEEYIGQIVKMNGICSVFHDEKRDIYFYTCEIKDETACCTLGIEFELAEGYEFPDDFPKDDDDVTVVGVFDTYKEGARTYKTLRKAVLV